MTKEMPHACMKVLDLVKTSSTQVKAECARCHKIYGYWNLTRVFEEKIYPEGAEGKFSLSQKLDLS
jgi:hypothetical protein